MQTTMDYILIYFNEAENILLTTAQVDYKSISPKLLCVMQCMFVPLPCLPPNPPPWVICWSPRPPCKASWRQGFWEILIRVRWGCEHGALMMSLEVIWMHSEMIAVYNKPRREFKMKPTLPVPSKGV